MTYLSGSAPNTAILKSQTTLFRNRQSGISTGMMIGVYPADLSGTILQILGNDIELRMQDGKTGWTTLSKVELKSESPLSVPQSNSEPSTFTQGIGTVMYDASFVTSLIGTVNLFRKRYAGHHVRTSLPWWLAGSALFVFGRMLKNGGMQRKPRT